MKTMFKRVATVVLVLPVALSLAGCGISLIDKQPPSEVYDLGAPDMSVGGGAVAWQLIIEEPSSIRAFGNSRIALRREGNSIQYFKGARWSDRAPRLIQARLIEALEDTGRIMSVGGETSGINAKYRLKSNLRSFHADMSSGASTTAVVGVSVKLLNAHTREIVATTLLEKKTKSRSGKIRDIVKAFDEAAQDVMRQTAEWVLEAGEAQEG